MIIEENSMKNKRIAIIGNQWITRYLINKLITYNIKPYLIISSAEKNSKQTSGYSDLRNIAKRNKIKYLIAEDFIISDELIKRIKKLSLDLAIVYGWQKLIPQTFINALHENIYGIHGGPFKPPRCKGKAVFNWAIIMGFKKFFLYLFKITDKADSGDIVDLAKFDIYETDNILSVYEKNCVISTRLILKNLNIILNKNSKYKKQNNNKSTYSLKRVPKNSGIDWTSSSTEIINLIRAVSKPYPSAFTFLRKRKVYIYEAKLFIGDDFYDNEPGEIVDIFDDSNHFVVKTKDSSILITSSSVSSKFLKTGEKFVIRSGVQIPYPNF